MIKDISKAGPQESFAAGSLGESKKRYTDAGVMPAIFQRTEQMKKLWRATHELFNEVAEKSTAAADEANYESSEESEGFWDELGADDDDTDAVG